MFKKLELVANVSIIVVALLIGIVLVKRYLLPSSEPSPVQIGTKINLPGVEWEKSEQTLLLVVSDTCHFCTESAGFYQRLAKQKTNVDGVRLIAVLPQEVNQGQQYLNKLGVAVDDVRQSQLGAIGVRVTPTLLLVDSKGAVKQSWLGKLTPDKENEVLSQFSIVRSAAR